MISRYDSPGQQADELPQSQWHLPTAGTAVGSSKEPHILVPAHSCLQSTVSAPAARGCLVLILKGITKSLWNKVLYEEAPGFLCLCWR